MSCPGIIKEGSTDIVSVKAIKVRLNELLGSTLDVTNGNFGPSTKLVVQQFQKKNQLISDGVIGELTWERLFTIVKPAVADSPILRLRALQILETQLFVREKTGHNDGAEVEKYLKNVGLEAGYSWCMAFVYWGFWMAAQQLKIPNLCPKTAGVLDCLERAKKYVVVGEPEAGDQFIMDFGGGHGHTGMVREVKGDRVYTVEGNTSADPTYAGEDQDGNGVFERSRAIVSIKHFIRYQ